MAADRKIKTPNRKVTLGVQNYARHFIAIKGALQVAAPPSTRRRHGSSGHSKEITFIPLQLKNKGENFTYHMV